jgi:hypothetical protein
MNSGRFQPVPFIVLDELPPDMFDCPARRFGDSASGASIRSDHRKQAGNTSVGWAVRQSVAKVRLCQLRLGEVIGR